MLNADQIWDQKVLTQHYRLLASPFKMKDFCLDVFLHIVKIILQYPVSKFFEAGLAENLSQTFLVESKIMGCIDCCCDSCCGGGSSNIRRASGPSCEACDDCYWMCYSCCYSRSNSSSR